MENNERRERKKTKMKTQKTSYSYDSLRNEHLNLVHWAFMNNLEQNLQSQTIDSQFNSSIVSLPSFPDELPHLLNLLPTIQSIWIDFDDGWLRYWKQRCVDEKATWCEWRQIGWIVAVLAQWTRVEASFNLTQQRGHFFVSEFTFADNSPKMKFGRFHAGFP